ncbi:hypothetical protein Nepgr_018071 [Nepenthes gracilis]|uniref:Uncharacterized protein n=1 Tax=Nepenthes gracilis TaxID=150966 RepID=A0AAD3XTZ5_NEPGR|nr:hypothetical protein Nepgr_018071 [Nepenthes gracilis]
MRLCKPLRERGGRGAGKICEGLAHLEDASSSIRFFAIREQSSDLESSPCLNITIPLRIKLTLLRIWKFARP